ncbi:MAG: 1-deoxy-D-xylulose-5-phosphate reductoisomerase [Anaerovoracaceae bacterium]
MKKICILGSTGSIGTQSLDIIEKNPQQFSVSVLSCGTSVSKLSEQIEKFKPQVAVVAFEKDAIALQKKHKNVEVLFGKEGLVQAATKGEHHMVLNSLMGIKGLEPTYNAILAGKDIALANKETLVAGGEVVVNAVKEKGVRMLPVDSEHSAIFQCLQGNKHSELSKILLTASGGPFRGYSLDQLQQVTLEQALKHPNWSMGSKITIDSATMMNKGLEVIEAKWLFDVELDQIEILVHPQSIVHSMVEYRDGSVIGQLGAPDMRTPIALAFSYPSRMDLDFPKVNFFEEGANLTFEKPDINTFKCIDLAYKASKAGGSYPVVLNGANEVLVDKFLRGEIKFVQIQETLERVLEEHKPSYNLTLEEIIEIDKKIRTEV